MKPQPTAQEIARALAVVRKSRPEEAEVLAQALAAKATENMRLEGHIRVLELRFSLIAAALRD